MTAFQSQPVPAFEEHLTTAFQEVRRTLGELLAASGLDPTEPQEMARRLKVSRNLTWKISKVVCGRDLFEALQHLPGDEGLEILVKAARQAGAGEESAERVRVAQRELDRLVEIHTGDRATLDLILDNMGGAGSAERLEQSRKLAYRGNSGVWGVQAKARMSTLIMMPAKSNPDLIDAAQVGGIIDFRRLRPNVCWPLFRPRLYTSDGELRPMVEEAIDPAFAGAEGPKLMSEFCTPMPLGLRRVPEGKSFFFELEETAIGNTGSITCFIGTVLRAVGPIHRSGDELTADFSAQISMPAEMLQLDICLHRSLDVWGHPESFLFGQLHGTEPRVQPYRIPVGERAEMLPGVPPLIHSTVMGNYERLMAYTFERLGWAQREFRVFRLMLRYPPMHSTAVMRFTLPERK